MFQVYRIGNRWTFDANERGGAPRMYAAANAAAHAALDAVTEVAAACRDQLDEAREADKAGTFFAAVHPDTAAAIHVLQPTGSAFSF